MQPGAVAEPVGSSERASGARLSPPPARARWERESLASWLTRDLVPKRSGRGLEPSTLPESEAPSVRREPFLREAAVPAGPEPSESPGPSAFDSPGSRVEPAPAAVPRSVPAALPSADPESPALTAPRDAARSSTARPLPSAPALGRERPSLREVVPTLERPPVLRPSIALELEAPLAGPLGERGEVPPSSVALAKSQPSSALSPLILEEDDLAVLPGRGRASGARRAKLALALMLGLLLVGTLIVVRLAPRAPGEPQASASHGQPTENGVLLPPPPSSELLPSAPEPGAAPSPARRANTESAEPEEAMDPRDPRFTQGGPNVRRYADVPSPTLSRLAREQRRLARERDEAVRNAKPAEASP
jgi:hypothetical protein